MATEISEGDYRVIVLNPSAKGRLAKHKRTVLVDHQNTIYLSPAVAGDSQTVILCALADAISFVQHEGRPYYPTNWLLESFPSQKDVIEHLSAITLRIIAEENASS